MALTDGILSYWNLNDDGSGGVSLLDSTGNGYTLTNVGGVTLGTGIIGGDAVFSTSGQFLGPVDFGNQNAYSVGAWLKWTSNATYNVYYSAVSNLGIQLYINPSGNIAFTNYGAGGVDYDTGIAFPADGNWHFITVTQNSLGNFTIYLDATSIYTNTFIPGSTAVNPTGLGARESDLAFTFNGQIDEVGTWSRELSPTEVYDLYYGGEGNTYPFTNPLPVPLTVGCKAYWNLNNNGSGGVSLIDSTGNGITLNNNGNVALGTGIIAGGASFTDTTPNWLQTTNGDFATYGPWSFTTWINPINYGTSSFGFNAGIVEFGTGAGAQGWLGLFSTSGNFCIINRASGLVYTSQNPIPLNAWTNITITFSGQYGGLVSSIYINGVLDGSVTSAFGYLDTNAVTFGTAYDQTGTTNLSYNGVIDESGFWNRALSQSDIILLYNNGSGITYPFLTLYYNNAQSDGDWGNLLNWWQDSGFSIQATALPTATNPVNLYNQVTQNTQGANQCFCSFANFWSADFGAGLTLQSTGVVNMQGSSVMAGTTTDSVSMHDSSQLASTSVIDGNVTMRDSSRAFGSILGNATVYYDGGNGQYPIGGTVTGSVTYLGWPAVSPQWFNDRVSGGANDGNFNNLANWWTNDSYTTRPINAEGQQVIPDASTDVFIGDNCVISTNTGTANPTINTLTANQSALEYISITVSNGAIFSNIGFLGGTIYGNVTFQTGAYNRYGVIHGNATYTSALSLQSSWNYDGLGNLNEGADYGSAGFIVNISGGGGGGTALGTNWISRLLHLPWFINV